MGKGMNFTRRLFMAGSAALLPGASALADSPPPYRNPHLSIDEPLPDLLSRMTLDEKVAQLRSLWFGKSAICNDDASFSAAKAAHAIPNGIGQVARPSDTAGTPLMITQRMRSIDDTVAWVNAIQ